MKQSDVIKILSRRTSITQETVQKVIKALGILMADAVKEKEPLKLSIGTFSYKIRPPKPAYDFTTNSKITLPPAEQVVYTPNVKMRQALNEHNIILANEFINKD